MTIEISSWQSFFEARVKAHKPIIAGYLRYLEVCSQLEIPPIFEFRHLGMLLGAEQDTLGWLISASPTRYRKFTIPKRMGGVREISVPHAALLEAQRWILSNIVYRSRSHPSAHGGVPGRSIRTNAAVHLSAKQVLKMDVQDFFGSVGIGFGVKYFSDLAYPPSVAQALALICFDQGKLPQGAATSPALANEAANILDHRLTGLAAKLGLSYSRYVDDMTFSGDRVWTKLPDLVSQISAASGFKINESKTVLATGASPKFVTGLSVGGAKLRLPRDYKRKLRNEAFQILRRGLEAHQSFSGLFDPLMLERVAGQLAFWTHIEDDNETARRLSNDFQVYRKSISLPAELPEPKRIVYPPEENFMKRPQITAAE